MSDAPLVFFDDSQPKEPASPLAIWKILVVDDDQDVHSVTEFVMHGVSILGRSLVFLHAFSAAEAREVLKRESDIAVIILDVVMESEDAGLHLVRTVREELGLTATRIILRTGQPGYAPEYEAIRDYDINDYRTKSELSYARLLTSLTAAIRSYMQIKTIAENGQGLEYIINASPDLLRRIAIDDFVPEALDKIAGLVPGLADLFFYLPDPQVRNSGFVIGGRGAFAPWINKPWALVAPDLSADRIDRVTVTMEQRTGSRSSRWFTLFLEGKGGRSAVLYGESGSPMDDQQLRLLDVMGISLAVGFRNLLLMNELRSLAFQDVTTGLLNRNGFIDQLDKMSNRDTGMVALVDIQGFSEINEALGHEFGDELLMAVASRLESSFGPDVNIGRVSADGFAILGKDVTVTRRQITDIFSQPFQVKQSSLYLQIMVGMVRLGEVRGDGADIVKDAFIALKQAKLQQRDRFIHYDPGFEDAARRKLDIIDELKRAMLEDSLEVHYQPQIDIGSGRMTGMEALLRWKNARGEQVSPVEFIPLAEQSGLIIDLGDWVFRRVCRQVREWLDMGYPPLRYAVNVSVRQFKSPSFIQRLSAMVREHRLDESRFEIEITESMAMHDVEEVYTLLTALKEKGFQLAIDDFGTGFSSLSYLQKLPIDRLKIDRAFVSRITESAADRAIAGLVVGLGRSLGLSVIAEGVENEGQLESLRILGCHESQGYLHGKPMDASAMGKLMKSLEAS